jgi:hypothetical protein
MKRLSIAALLAACAVVSLAAQEAPRAGTPTFQWQLFNNDNTEMELDFININPLFCSCDRAILNEYQFFNIIDNNIKNNWDKRNNNTVDNNGNDWVGFILGIAAYSIIWADYYNNPEAWDKYKYLNDEWEKRIKENEWSVFQNRARERTVN